MLNIFQTSFVDTATQMLGRGCILTINMKHITTYFTVMEWLGSDCQAAQLN